MFENAFCQMRVTLQASWTTNVQDDVGDLTRMRARYTAKWGVQLAGMIFQTRSRTWNPCSADLLYSFEFWAADIQSDAVNLF